MDRAELYENIIKTYNETGSVKDTATKLHTSVVKVRRVLITEGLWSSPTSLKILALYEDGLTVAQIAEKLNYSEKNVQAFLPYTRGAYGGESTYSTTSKEYRERMQLAASRQVRAGSLPPNGMARQAIRHHEDSDGQHTKKPMALKLHLELDTEGLSAEELCILKEHGKMKKAISRDIIIPADMTLHALHYAIQRLFGWQNSHLHHYAFPNDVFEHVTRNSFDRWLRLCGIYFRFPQEESDDLFWDDNYEPVMSFKSWLKSKYSGPYGYGGMGDHYYENQRLVRELKQDMPVLKVYDGKKTREVPIESATLDDARNSIYLGGPMNYLLEKMTVADYIFLPDNDYFLTPIDEDIQFLESGEKLAKRWEEITADLENNYAEFESIAFVTTVRLQAQTHRLDYFYDYGDDWKVSITCSEAYYMSDLMEQDNAPIQKVTTKQEPICVKADGLPVMEDVGGISGYVEFLSAIHNSYDEDERAELLEWANSMRWSGRSSGVASML